MQPRYGCETDVIRNKARAGKNRSKYTNQGGSWMKNFTIDANDYDETNSKLKRWLGI